MKKKLIEDWKLSLLKKHLKMLKEDKIKGTVTRDEIRDVEIRIYYFQRGYEKGKKDALSEDGGEK